MNTEQLPERLVTARTRANTLCLEAEEKEAEARRARQRAKSAQRHYESLLRQHQGEDSLPFEFTADVTHTRSTTEAYVNIDRS